MEEANRILQRKRAIILATLGLLILNAALSITLTNVTPDQTGTQTTNWSEIFICIRPFSILLYIIYLLSLFEKTFAIEQKIVLFVVKHINDIFLCVIFVYLALYEMYNAYFADYFISVDSSSYMREVSNLLEGNGFYCDKLAGYDTWFASWPIGYPVLVALFTFISGHSVYLGSKLLSIALVGLGLIILRIRFKEDAWIFSLIYLNIGFLNIYKYTWSENPFIFCIMIWGISLGVIVEEKAPEKQWYVVTALGILAAFLTRYFGIVTILFTGFCLMLYILYYIIKDKNAFILTKIKGLLCVEMVSSIVVVLYLFMNQTMGGSISGVDRKLWWDDYNNLINNLYNALMTEIFNATRIDIISLMPNVYSQGGAAVIILFLVVLTIILIKSYQKEKLIDYKIVFIGAGIFYYIIFIIVRFYSSMDNFSYRFFAPAGMMVSVGVLGLIKDKFGERLKKIQIVICIFLLILCCDFVKSIKYYTIETSAYHIFYNQVVEAVASIPSKGIILNYNGEYQLEAFRPDIMVYGRIAYDDTLETIISKYEKSTSIWIQRDVLNAIINDENYSAEIRNTFSQYVIEGANKEEYIRIY